jgi:hypothetical protein
MRAARQFHLDMCDFALQAQLGVLDGLSEAQADALPRWHLSMK